MENLNIFDSFDQKIDYQYLSINLEKIKLLADDENFQNLIIPDWQEEVFLVEKSEFDINFIFLINKINFSYWPEPQKSKWYFIYNDKKYTGSMALFASLKEAIKQGYSLFDAKYLSEISEKDLKSILEKYQQIPMFEKRLNILREIGKNLIDNGYNSFYEIFKNSNKSAIQLIKNIIKIFPSFNDSFIYQGENYSFLKRAQLIPAMIYGRYQGKGLGEFTDINKLTVFADYRVPQTLRKLGLVNYSEKLSDKIKNKIYLAEGSTEELEIRISTIQTANILKSLLNEKNDKFNSLHIDYYMWKNGKNILEPNYDFHRTRTIYY